MKTGGLYFYICRPPFHDVPVFFYRNVASSFIHMKSGLLFCMFCCCRNLLCGYRCLLCAVWYGGAQGDQRIFLPSPENIGEAGKVFLIHDTYALSLSGLVLESYTCRWHGCRLSGGYHRWASADIRGRIHR